MRMARRAGLFPNSICWCTHSLVYGQKESLPITILKSMNMSTNGCSLYTGAEVKTKHNQWIAILDLIAGDVVDYKSVTTGSPHSRNGSPTTGLGLSLEAGPCLAVQEWLFRGVSQLIFKLRKTKRKEMIIYIGSGHMTGGCVAVCDKKRARKRGQWTRWTKPSGSQVWFPSGSRDFTLHIWEWEVLWPIVSPFHPSAQDLPLH